MKQSLHRTIFCMLLSVLGMVSSAWAEDVTYTVLSTSQVEVSGTAPEGSSFRYSSTYNTKCQLLAGKKMTLTLSGYQGKKITGITLSMRSNKAAGAGYYYMNVGSTEISSIGTSTSGISFSDKAWNGAYNNSTYSPITPSVTETTVQNGEDVVVVIGATENSLYCDAFKISYIDSDDVPVDRTLSSIELNTEAAQKEFYTYDEFTHDGVVVTANFEEADVKSSVVSANFSAPDMTTPGTKTVTVSYTENGVTKTATYDIDVKTIANTAETAYTVAEAKALIDAGKGLKQGVYVKGVVSEIVTAFNTDKGYLSFNISADGGTIGDQFQFYCNYKGADNQKWASAAETPQVGCSVVGYGLLAKYKDIYEYAAGNYVVSMKSLDKKVATITATYAESLMATATDEYDVTYDGDAELTITSSNEDVATATIVDGHVVITAKSKGEAVITISATGTASYLPASLHYTLTVNDDSVLDATWVAEDMNLKNGTEVKTAVVNEAITLFFSSSDEKKAQPSYWETGKGVRLYNASNMQVKAADGYIITRIALYTTSSDEYAAVQGTLKIGNPSVWMGCESAVDIYFAGTTGHVRISKLVIDYKVGDETAVTQLTVPVATDGAIYNLAGQRVSKAQKGLFIVNGKKVMVK